MIQMQNLQSSLTDTVFAASGQSDNMTSGTGTAGSFDTILSSVSRHSGSGSKDQAGGSSGSRSDRVTSGSRNEAETGRESCTDSRSSLGEEASAAADEKDAVAGGQEQILQGSVLMADLLAMMSLTAEASPQEAAGQAAEAVTGAELMQSLAVPDATTEAQTVLQVQEVLQTEQSAEAEAFSVKAGTQQTEAAVSEKTAGTEAEAAPASEGAQKQEMNTGARNPSGSFTQRAQGHEKAAVQQDGNRQEQEAAPEGVQGVPDRAAPVQSQTENGFFQAKVGDGARLEQAVVEQTTDTISAKLSEGVQEFEMTLSPEALGKVTIRIVFAEGKAQVSMACTEPAAHKALLANVEAVKQLVEADTGMETTVTMETPADKFGSYEDQRHQERNREENSTSQEETEGSDENDTLSFIQQLRLGLTGQKEAV
ncbi:MAG: flagellar hook-length control protein FliK [Anaerovoracaceae bacterium]